MKREKVRAEELDFIYTDDKDTCQFLPLIEKPVGDVTYEQCLAVRFYGDVYMGTAQRNYYADRYHEICLCAHYNRRIPGKYEFEEGYQFFVTKKRMCLDIYWNLGNISNTDSVLEHYHSIESAVNSNYYRDFCDLKSQIEEGVKRKKARAVNMFEEDVGISFHPVEDVNGKSRYIMCEIPIIERKEFVQFYLSKGTQSWDRMSISLEPISEMMSFFKDFDELDKKVLHLRKYRLLRSLDPEKDKDLLIAFEKIKKGIGYALMKKALDALSEYPQTAVWVLTGNERAIRFYKRCGFEFDGQKKEIELGTPATEARMILRIQKR